MRSIGIVKVNSLMNSEVNLRPVDEAVGEAIFATDSILKNREGGLAYQSWSALDQPNLPTSGTKATGISSSTSYFPPRRTQRSRN